MSIVLPPAASVPEEDYDDSTDSSDDDEPEPFDDWFSDSAACQPCRSLFEQKELPSVQEALAYDKDTHGFDLNAFCRTLGTWLCFVFVVIFF